MGNIAGSLMGLGILFLGLGLFVTVPQILRGDDMNLVLNSGGGFLVMGGGIALLVGGSTKLPKVGPTIENGLEALVAQLKNINIKP